MDIWVAFDNLADFYLTFTDWLFSPLKFYGLFDIDSGGLLGFWPFFVVTAIFIVFLILKGIVRLISDL